MHPAWIWITVAFFASGFAFMLLSAYAFLRIGEEITPLLAETQRQLQDLGDLAANTVGRAAETADIVEMRVSQAMGQAVEAGGTVRRQTLGVGLAVAGLYVVTHILRSRRKPSRRRRR